MEKDELKKIIRLHTRGGVKLSKWGEEGNTTPCDNSDGRWETFLCSRSGLGCWLLSLGGSWSLLGGSSGGGRLLLGWGSVLDVASPQRQVVSEELHDELVWGRGCRVRRFEIVMMSKCALSLSNLNRTLPGRDRARPLLLTVESL